VRVLKVHGMFLKLAGSSESKLKFLLLIIINFNILISRNIFYHSTNCSIMFSRSDCLSWTVLRLVQERNRDHFNESCQGLFFLFFSEYMQPNPSKSILQYYLSQKKGKDKTTFGMQSHWNHLKRTN
jgi:hypothetical protein